MDRKGFFNTIRPTDNSNSPDIKPAAIINVINSGLAPFKGRIDTVEAVHLLKRTMFGAKQSDVTHFKKKKLKKIMDEMLHAEEMPAPPVNNYNDTDDKKEDANYYVDPEVASGATWVNNLTSNGKNNGRRRNSLKAWWLGLMINQQRTLQEKMVLFWHNHFATETAVVDNPFFLYQHNMLLRKYALGNFKEMVIAVTKDPAMLKYLNGTASTKKAPDENYGRELQELFTVGKGPGSHYTENDVKAAARVLTGFRIDYKTPTSVYDPARHDEGDKTFSEFYNNTKIAGLKKEDGAKELDQMIDMIFAQQEVSLFICRKLYRFFVYHQIDAATETNIIAPLAAMFRKNNYEIKPVLETLLSSQHFFDSANYGSMIKSPVDFVVGLCREFNLGFPDASKFIEQYALFQQLQQQTAAMQQNIGDPPNVAGWQAYYQEPQFDKLWISSDTLPKRNQFTDRMINNGIVKNDERVNIDVVAFTKQLEHADNPDLLIDQIIHLLYAIDIKPSEKQFIKSNTLLSGLTGMQSDHYWTDSWNLFISNPGDKKNTDLVLKKLKSLYRYIMNRPEYQLC